jgi:hypothetical protein
MVSPDSSSPTPSTSSANKIRRNAVEDSDVPEPTVEVDI